MPSDDEEIESIDVGSEEEVESDSEEEFDKEEFASTISDCLQRSTTALQSVIHVYNQVKSVMFSGQTIQDVEDEEFEQYANALGQMMVGIAMGKSINKYKVEDEEADPILKCRPVLDKVTPMDATARAELDVLFGKNRQFEKGGSEKKNVKSGEVDEDEDLDLGDDEADEVDEENEDDEIRLNRKISRDKNEGDELEEPVDDVEMERRFIRIEKARRRALKSSLIRDLRREHSDAPDVINDGPTSFIEKQQKKYEEQNYKPLVLTKREKKMLGQHKRNHSTPRDELSHLLNFGNYRAMDKAVENSGKAQKRSRGIKRSVAPAKRRKMSRRK